MESTIALDLSGLLGNDGGDVGDRGNREYGCSLFPGQIVAVEGINPSGRTMRVTRVIEGLGFELVRIRLMGGATRTLQIMADRPAGGIEVDELGEISIAVSATLDVEDPIEENYVLEVSSPGIDRPLFNVAQFAQFQGETAKVGLKLPQDGRRRLTGRITAVEGDTVTFDVDGSAFTVQADNIEKARLVPDLVALGLASEGPKGRPRKPHPKNEG